MLICLLFAVSANQIIQVALITSSLTPQSLLSSLSSNLQGVISEVEQTLNSEVSFKLLHESIDQILPLGESQWSIPPLTIDHNIQVILDAGFSIRYSNFLSDRCGKLSLLHIVISRPINTLSDETPYSSTLYADTSYLDQGQAISDLISHYSWQNLGIIHDKTIEVIQSVNSLKAEIKSPASILDEVILDTEQSIETSQITSRLKSTTQDSGARVIVVLCKNNVAAQVLRAADTSVMGGVGHVWILDGHAMDNIGLTLKNSYEAVEVTDLSVVKSGAIGIRPSDFEFIKEEPLATYMSVLSLVGKSYLTLGKNPSGKEIRSYILTNPSIPSLQYPLKFNKEGLKLVDYKFYNINNFAEIEVGKWNSLTRKITLSESLKIIWPGFTYIIPNDKIPIIQLGLLYPAHDNDGNSLKLGREVLRGFSLALIDINNDPTLLNGYQIQGITTDTFLLPSLAQVNLQKLNKDNIIGFVGPHNEELCEAYVEAQSYYSDQKPLITNLASSTLLADSNNYPNVLQIIQPDGLQAVAMTLFIQLQGWKKIGVIYTNDNFGLSLYTSFIANIGTLDVSIENDEADRVIKYKLNDDGEITQSTKDSVDDALVQIVRNQIKVIVYLGNPNLGPELAKVGYKKELQGDEYAWVGPMWLTEDIINSLDTQYKDDKKDILKVFNGAIGLDYRNGQGEVGTAYANSYLEAYGETYSKQSMLTYDSVYTYASVLSGILGRGDNYDSGKDLINSLRSADLTGVSGKIKFSEGSNGRSAYGYNIVNYQNNTILEVLEYDPLNPNLFTVLNNHSIVWGDKSSSTPSDDWSSNYDCPFAKHMSKTSPRGLGIIISIGTFLFIITLILSYFSYKKWKQIEIVPITSPVIRSWKDTLVQAQIAIEFFQFIAIAPTFSSLEIVIKAASNIFMLDIMKVASSNKSDYWILLAAICALCYVWFFLVLIIMLNGEHWLRKVPFFKRIVSILNSLFLPFFGNTFFLPALALLLDMFVCDHRAQGKDYVWRDCYTNCWEGKHKTFIVMSSIAILCYEPIAAYSRPLWQQSRTGLNLKIQPFFLLLKTCVQILLIAIGKSLQSTSPVAHGVVYTILISIFAGLIYKLQPFNYHRCNLWEFSSILAVSYLSFLATLSYSKDPENVGWFIALALGWALIFLVSFLIQRRKMPNLLLPPSGSRTTKKIYDIISLKGNHPDDMDESNVSKMQDIKKGEESSIQVEYRVEDDSKIEDDSKDYIEVKPMINEDNSK